MQKNTLALSRGGALGRFADASAGQKIALAVFGSLLLAASSRIEVPMIPVPMTMQTYALLLLGAFLGSRLAFASVLAYLAEGALGLPVFAGGAAGLQHFFGPTAGYLLAFPFAAYIVGLAAERGWLGNLFIAFLVMLASHAIVFTGGVAWLAQFMDVSKAVAVGFTPFVLGTLVKSALGVATVQLWPRRA